MMTHNLHLKILRLSLGIAMFAACGQCSRGDSHENRVRLATTTSTDSSGLLEYMLPPFQASEGLDVQVVAVGTGQALELGRRGDVDVVLVHDRVREDAIVAEGFGIDRHDVMWNDFVLVGPPADPAGVRKLTDVAAAFRRVRAANQTFLSRGDDSGTHQRERLIWERAGGSMPSGGFYLEAGQGMGKCLILADQKKAYLLADRGTFLAFRARLDLQILVEGDPFLRNPYGIILVNPQKHPHVNEKGARRLMSYFTSAAGQRRIGDFRVGGAALFHPVE